MERQETIQRLIHQSERCLLLARLLGAAARGAHADTVATAWVTHLARAVAPDEPDATMLRMTLDTLADRLDRGDVAEAHRTTFGHIPAGRFSPYETSYGSTNAFTQSQTLANLAGYYRAFGVEPGPTHGERADHLGVECEFVAFLLHKEALALQSADGEHAAVCQSARRRFLQEHLGRWAPVVFARLEDEAPAEIYRLAGRVGRMVLAAELAAVGAKCAALEGAAPPPDGVAEDYCPELFACPGTSDAALCES